MGQTLTNGIYLPNEGERNCYSGLAANWNAVDTLKGNYSLHAINVDIHVTAAEKETWNGKADNSALTAHTGDTTIHVTAEDKQAWNGHVADTTIHVTSVDKQAWNEHVADTVKHVTASDKTTWNTVTSKANDSDVVHKLGNETVSGQKTFDSNTYVYNSDNTATTPNLYLKSSKVEISSQGNTSGDQNLTYLDKNNTTYAYVKGAIQSNGSAVKIRTIAKGSSDNSVINELQILAYTNGKKAIFPTYSDEVDLGVSNYKWKSIFATNYYYGNDNIEFSTKFVTTDTAQTISGDKTFSSINGVEPSLLSLPSQTYVDISSYFTNTGTGEYNTYTASANGWIFLRLGNISGCQADIFDTNNNRMWGQSSIGSVEQITIPILKGQKLTTQWNTSSTVTVAIARFYPCQGNV